VIESVEQLLGIVCNVLFQFRLVALDHDAEFLLSLDPFEAIVLVFLEVSNLLSGILSIKHLLHFGSLFCLDSDVDFLISSEGHFPFVLTLLRDVLFVYRIKQSVSVLGNIGK
jgi:hypothetical protein